MNNPRQKNENTNGLIRKVVILFDIIIVLGILSAFMLWDDKALPIYFISSTKISYFVALFSIFSAEYFFSTIIHIREISPEKVLWRTTKLALMYNICFFLILRFLSSGGGLFHFMILYATTTWIGLLLLRFSERALLKKLRKQGRNTRSVLFIGSDPANVMIYNAMSDDPSTGYKIIGYYSNNKTDSDDANFNHLGTLDDFSDYMKENSDFLLKEVESGKDNKTNQKRNKDNIEEIFVSLSHSDSDFIVNIMKFCDRNLIRFYYVPRMFGNFRLNFKPENLFGQTIFTNRIEPLALPGNRILKRTFDVVFSGFVCLCMLPLLPVIAICIKIQSPGPIFFKQDRTGLNGKTFKCYKFRSMHMSKDADTKQATKDDPRKFAFGNFMRKTNIDELPQFLNVLKGDMSIVGPRPHMIFHTEMYSKIIDKYMVRHFCKPGITGWAQVTGFRGETKELWQMEERVKRDIWYLENWTPLLDIIIILKTVLSIIKPDKHAY